METRDSESRSSYAPSELESEDSHETRPNCWKGAPSTWQFLTAPERGLAASLDQLRNQDLGIHLYNSFALNKRAQGFLDAQSDKAHASLENREPEIEVGDDNGQGWAPPKSWSAWPMAPDTVPRTGERIGTDDENDDFTLKRREAERPSRELEDVLIGVMLKLAKEKFEKRRWAEPEKSVDDVQFDKNDESSEQVLSSPDSAEEANPDNDQEPIIKEQSEPPSEKKFLKPAVSTDDQRSQELLRPSIRHTLSKLDDILMALHHARKTCSHYASQSEVTTDEETTRASSTARDSSTGSKRPRGRPRKFADLASRPKPDANEQPPELDDPELLRAKKTHRGRPLKKYDRLEGETQEEYLIRIARLQKKPLPSFAPPRDTATPEIPSSPAKSPGKSPVKRATSEELKARRKRNLDLRGWSEVLGSAALVGFPPDVVARATQRCANLFGEEIRMRTLEEAPFLIKGADSELHFEPEKIPVLLLSSSESEADEPRPSSRAFAKRRIRRLPRREFYPCPIAGCPRQEQWFSDVSSLEKHLEKGHQMTEDEIRDILDSDEEVDGAVHVDGFLRPAKNRWGHGGRRIRKKGQRSQKRETDENGGNDDNAEKESSRREPPQADADGGTNKDLNEDAGDDGEDEESSSDPA